MKLTFSQGLARYQTDVYATPTFLQKSSQTGEYIDLIVSPDPTIIIFAHKGATYVVEETKTVVHAWGPFPQAGTKYLYWDINLLDASITRGFTLFPQVVSAVAPQNPAVDQHWFDTTQNQFKVWNGSKWVDKVRVFAASYTASAVIQPMPLGSQANLTGNFEAGNLVLDTYNKPLRQSDGTFVTSTSELSIINASSKKVKFEAEVISGMAAEYIPKFSFVQVRPNRRLILARSDDWRSRIAGLVNEDLYDSEVGIVTTDGLVRNEQWSWPSDTVGRPVFCGLTGQVTLTPPTAGVNQVAGYVFDVDSIYLNIQQVTVLDDVTNEVTTAPASPNPPPIADFYAQPMVGAAPLLVSFTNQSLHNPTEFEWDFKGDGSAKATTQHAAFTYTQPGSYTVKLKVTNAYGEDWETKTGYITVNAPVSSGLFTNLGIQLNGPLQVAQGENFVLTIVVSNDGRKNATDVRRTVTIEDIGNDAPALVSLPTGATTQVVGKAIAVSLPVIGLATGGNASTNITINASLGHAGTIKITGVVTSPEQDVTSSDNVTTLSIKVK